MITTFISVLWFGAVNVIAILLINSKKQAEHLLKFFSCLLLIYKSTEYIYYNIKGYSNAFPVEFSAVTYFLFPIVYLLRIKKLEQLAVFCALFSGFFYMFTFLFVGSGMFKYNGGAFKTLITFFNHSLLYFLAILKLKFYKYNKSDIYKVIVGMFLIIFYAWAMKPFIKLDDSVIFVYKLIDGSIINLIIPSFKGFNNFMPLYYLSIILVSVFALNFCYKINRRLYLFNLKKSYFERLLYIEK